MDIRLRKTGEYIADIESLRTRIRVNGTTAQLCIITISHPHTARTVNMHLNLAFDTNSNNKRINSSLYAVSFGNENGIWHFNVGNIGVALPGQVFPNNINGSYKSLGFAEQLPVVSDANLKQAIEDVSRFNGGNAVPPKVKAGMARLIVAISEAARFNKIVNDINSVLAGRTTEYEPPVDRIRNWGGHVIGV
jgi:hypothetical protein